MTTCWCAPVPLASSNRGDVTSRSRRTCKEVNDNYAEAHFDLVICDYRLPDGDGLMLADCIKEHCEIQPAFILISGDTAPEILQAVNERGLHLLHKPVRPAKLRSLMLFLLKKRDEGV